MNRIMMSTLVCVCAAGVSARAQDFTHEHGVAPGRGDVHSKGWDAALKFKGAPIPPRFPELGRDAKRFALDNGLVLFVRADRRLPLIQMNALIRSGSCYETPDEYGVADYMGSLIRSGGTAKWKPQELDDRLAFLAANLSAGVGEDSANVSLDLLSKDAEEGLAIFADVIRNPAFDEGRLTLAKRRAANGLLHRNDNPGGVLSRELNALFFPETHPSGRSLTPTQLAAVTPARIRAFHARFFRPENTWISVTGDFDEKEMVDRVRAAFDDWKKVGEPVAAPAKFEAKPKPGVFFVGKELNQSSVSVAHPGIDRANPDRYAVQLMNSILGGGSFSSRITESVRSNEGLAYSARSAFPTGGREPDLFQATVQTKTGIDRPRRRAPHPGAQEDAGRSDLEERVRDGEGVGPLWDGLPELPSGRRRQSPHAPRVRRAPPRSGSHRLRRTLGGDAGSRRLRREEVPPPGPDHDLRRRRRGRGSEGPERVRRAEADHARGVRPERDPGSRGFADSLNTPTGCAPP